ncbi:site-specific integrase [Glycomyces tarimensis]
MLDVSRGTCLHGYIALSVFTGVRTEEARPLKWRNTHLNLVADQVCTAANGIARQWFRTWRCSARWDSKGDTKTPKSLRTIALPRQVVTILTAVRASTEIAAEDAGRALRPDTYVLASEVGTVRYAANVRRDLRKGVRAAGAEALGDHFESGQLGSLGIKESGV